MTVFSVVDDLYNVSVYFTLHDLCEDREDLNAFIISVGGEDRRPASRAEIRKAFRDRDVVELSGDVSGNWKYKMVRHT